MVEKATEYYELIYQSQSTGDLTPEKLHDLLITYRLDNERHGITGCLLYHNREFVQLLEGSKENVLQLFENIQNDKSNRNAEIIWAGSISQRGFSKWSMAYIDPTGISNNEAYSEYLSTGKLSHDIPEVITISKNLLANLKESLVY